MIDAEVAAMKTRGEYVSDLVLNDKWINPQTQQPTKVSDFGARLWIDLNAKINASPIHRAKLANLEAMGEGGKAARVAELARLTNLYLPSILDSHRWRIQVGKAPGAPVPASEQVARVEPQSQGTAVPSTLSGAEVRQWAEAEAAKDPSWQGMDARTREQMIISLGARKRFGG